jgi:hypothetical protein
MEDTKPTMTTPLPMKRQRLGDANVDVDDYSCNNEDEPDEKLATTTTAAATTTTTASTAAVTPEKRETIETATHAILAYLHIHGSATVKELHSTLGLSLRRIYDILNVLQAVPNVETPLVRKLPGMHGASMHHRFIFVQGVPWPEGLHLGNLEVALRTETRLLAIAASQTAILRAALHSPDANAAEVKARLQAAAAARPVRPSLLL